MRTNVSTIIKAWPNQNYGGCLWIAFIFGWALWLVGLINLSEKRLFRFVVTVFIHTVVSIIHFYLPEYRVWMGYSSGVATLIISFSVPQIFQVSWEVLTDNHFNVALAVGAAFIAVLPWYASIFWLPRLASII